MRSTAMYSTVETHTEGMPTRVVTGGVGELPGASMAERRQYLMSQRDDLRTLLMFEPRGHRSMSGAILQAATRPDADVGVVFIEASGCLPMCGHGTIGVATALVETGMVPVVEPVTVIRLDTPAGLVEAAVRVERGRAVSVRLRNVASYLHLRDTVVNVPSLGQVVLDVAWGGNFYAILPAEAVGLDVLPAQHDAIVATGLAIMAAVGEQLSFTHPELPGVDECRHVILTAPGDGEVSSRGAVAIHPGWVDRSPCGTGTSARMAALHARGELPLHQPFVHASLIGSRFVGELVGTTLVGDRPAVVPTVTGRAWVTGTANYLLDPDDPFPAGFLV